jgi:phosphoribosylformylglycinamidine cyclo-ligase
MHEDSRPRSYREAGVDVDGADRFVDYIKGIPSPSIGGNLGAFGAAVEVPMGQMRNPLLVSTTDGVGTKILVARSLQDYSTIGIDLVAMNVNDLAVCGARPLSFLDYIACGALNDGVLRSVIDGIVRGCEIAGCTLAGGETAEMPDLYGSDDIDLAGFCTGIVEADGMLPRLGEMEAGAVVYGLPSSGIHSNGLSLARRALEGPNNPHWQSLLKPTRIYVRELLALISSGFVSAAAHVTGGGLTANLRRVIPEDLTPDITWDWEVPEIFDVIRYHGGIPEQEMRKVFNMGIGVAVVVPAPSKEAFEALALSKDIAILQIGTLRRG